MSLNTIAASSGIRRSGWSVISTASSGIADRLEDVAVATELAVFGKVAARLSHEPDRASGRRVLDGARRADGRQTGPRAPGYGEPSDGTSGEHRGVRWRGALARPVCILRLRPVASNTASIRRSMSNGLTT